MARGRSEGRARGPRRNVWRRGAPRAPDIGRHDLGAVRAVQYKIRNCADRRDRAMKTAAGQEQIGNAEAAAKATNVKCAFCDSTGKDPFDLLSSLSRCPVCKGRGAIAVKTPTIPCAYCRGTGRGRHTRLACSGCGGAGVIALAGPTTRCPQCDGSGREPEADLPCSLCRGAGLVAVEAAQGKKARRPQEASRKT